MWTGDTDGLAGGAFDPPVRGDLRGAGTGARGRMPVRPGCGAARRLPMCTGDGMITKAEVRAVALGKLRLPTAGVLWDVGAGSGSVAAECARLAPGLRVFAIERRADGADQPPRQSAPAPRPWWSMARPPGRSGRLARSRTGCSSAAAGWRCWSGVLARLRPGGAVVATYAALDRAAAAAARLGHLVQVAVSRGVSIGDAGSVRLHAENPVFVCWGPAE